MNLGSPWRRGAIAVLAVALAAQILRPQLAQALIVRGDEQLYAGRPFEALAYYARAVRMNPRDGVAVDRFAFAALTLRNEAAVDESIHLATAYLRTTEDRAVRLDRAMAYRARGKYANALADFSRAGVSDGDVTALTFAGLMAMRLGRRSEAIVWWRRAVAVAPRWLPALRALRRAGAQP